MKKSNENTKHRWLNIGPGLLLALAISMLIGSQWIKSEMKAKQQAAAPPIIERQLVTSSQEEKTGLIPEVSFITDRKDKIRLTHDQLTRLQKLQAEWKAYSTPKIAQAREAAAKAESYLSDTKTHTRTPTAQIQDQAAPLIALSGELASARRSYWEQAMKVLTSKQRIIVQKEREKNWEARKLSPAAQ